jgi:ABC-type transport system substrate-binding protein
MLETGEADLSLKMPPIEIERLKNQAQIDVLTAPTNRVIGFYVNTTAPLVNDVRFRRALAYAIDRDAIIKHIMKGIARPCCSVIGGGTFGEVTPMCYDYNPAKSRQLLKEMGYQGEELILWTPQGRYTYDRETSEAVQGYWKEVGINAKLRVMEFAGLSKAMQLPPEKVKYQIALLGAGPTTGDGDQILRRRYNSSQIPPNGVNISHYRNDEYDNYSNAQTFEPDEKKRLELMKKCQDILARDLPYIPLYTIDQVIGIRKKLKEVVNWKGKEMTLVREAYFQK